MERSNTISYLTFDATVGRNSTFKGLTRAQEEELGGVEFRVSKFSSFIGKMMNYWL